MQLFTLPECSCPQQAGIEEGHRPQTPYSASVDLPGPSMGPVCFPASAYSFLAVLFADSNGRLHRAEIVLQVHKCAQGGFAHLEAQSPIDSQVKINQVHLRPLYLGPHLMST